MLNINQDTGMHLDFSVAISVYKNDNPIFFDRALESIYTSQTVKPSEIVLVVDGPISEELKEIIRKYENICRSILKVIRLEKNCGLGNALSIAVENSSNELIARMDSDDVSVPDRFEQQLRIIQSNPSLDIIGGDISEFIDDETNIIAYRKVPVQDKDIKEYLKRRSPLNHVSVLFKKKAVRESGGYLDLFWNEDYYLWIRMAEHGCTMANTGSVLVNVRVGADMYKRRGGKKYFASEKFLQDYMLRKEMITWFTYFSNISNRFIIQCILPDSIREWIFIKFAREKM